MPHYDSSYDQLRELELRRQMRQKAAPPPSRTYQRRYPKNTLGPSDDVLEHRRHLKNKRVIVRGASPENRNLLLENLLLLLVLAGSIWGLYSLSIYLLTQP